MDNFRWTGPGADRSFQDMSDEHKYIPDEFGRDERSLVRLPFTLLGRSGRREDGAIRSEWEGKDHKGRARRFFKEVTGDSKHGLPSYPAEDVFVALLYCAARSGFTERTMHVVPRHLLQRMGWDQGGSAYRRLKKSLKQLKGVNIHTNALWNDRSKAFVEGQFAIIDNWELIETEDAPLFGEEGGQVLEIKWNERLFQHFQDGRLKMLNVDVFYSLSTPLAKRLYRWIDDALYPTRHAQIDVLLLAHTRLEISRSKKYVSQVMQTLEPALAELAERGICEWRLEDSQTQSGKKFVFTAPPPQLRAAPSGEKEPQTTENRWLREHLQAMTEEECQELKNRAIGMLDPFNKQIYFEKGDAALGAAALIRDNMMTLLKGA